MSMQETRVAGWAGGRMIVGIPSRMRRALGWEKGDRIVARMPVDRDVIILAKETDTEEMEDQA